MILRTQRLAWLVAAAMVAASCTDDAAGSEAAGTTPETAPPATADSEPDADPPPATEADPPPPTTDADPPPATEADPPPAAEADPAPATTDAPPASDAPREYDLSAVSPVVQDFVDERGLNGAGLIVVHRDDGVIHHEHWGEFDEDRISLVASSSKMLTAGVLLHLQDEGVLDIEAPVADVAEWGTGNPTVTPAQLLSNSSGLVGLLPDPAYGPYLCQYLAVGTLQECAADIFTTDLDDGDIISPDTEFRYGGAQWQVAGAVAEVASGRSWAELIEEIYVEPCGLEALAYNNHFTQIGTGGFDYPVEFDGDPTTLDPTANPNMEGGAYVTTGDYGKLLLMHLRGGRCGDVEVLSQEALDAMHGDRIAAAYEGDAGIATGYGLGWWVDRTTGRISDGGAYGSVPWLDLDDGYGAYLVIEADSGLGNELAQQLYDLIDDAVNAA